MLSSLFKNIPLCSWLIKRNEPRSALYWKWSLYYHQTPGGLCSPSIDCNTDPQGHYIRKCLQNATLWERGGIRGLNGNGNNIIKNFKKIIKF